MILFPNCKINLGLSITAKRDDGYHDLETIFFPLPLKDALELNQSPKSSSKDLELLVSGNAIPGETEQNLCYKAWQLLKADFPDLPRLRLHLLKAIPTGAGLGGGSSDGAQTLLLINRECRLELSEAQLIDYALQLGSDCPFFIYNKPCLATGRGEHMKPVTVSLPDYYFVLVDPGIHIGTGWAFRRITPKPRAERSLEKIIAMPPHSWKENLKNDFEEPVFAEYAALEQIRESLYARGAVYASMTGTGSAIYGLFLENSKPDLSDLRSQYTVYDLKPCK